MRNINNKTILITGGSGFIGHNFIKLLLQKKIKNLKIINIDKLTNASDDLVFTLTAENVHIINKTSFNTLVTKQPNVNITANGEGRNAEIDKICSSTQGVVTAVIESNNFA